MDTNSDQGKNQIELILDSAEESIEMCKNIVHNTRIIVVCMSVVMLCQSAAIIALALYVKRNT